jgi:hypothetical protein
MNKLFLAKEITIIEANKINISGVITVIQYRIAIYILTNYGVLYDII